MLLLCRYGTLWKPPQAVQFLNIESSIRTILGWRNGWISRGKLLALPPGGVVYSLNPLDQARLLAIQFHQLVLKVSEVGLPLIFPVFPRIVTDWEYLHRCMEPILPAHITKEISRAAHARVADVSKVRVTREISTRNQSNVVYRPELFVGPRYPSSSEIDNIALRREIVRIREEQESRSAQLGINHQREILEGTIQR